MRDWKRNSDLCNKILNKDLNQELVAHYTTREIAFEKILDSKSIKLSSLSNTNDPAEFISRITAFRDENELTDNIEEHFTKNILTFCCCLSDPKNIDKKVNLSSFGKPKMWAHYGQNHEGICLVFNKEKLNTCLEEILDNDRLFCDRISYGPYRNEPFVIRIPPINEPDPYRFVRTEDEIQNDVLNHLNSYCKELIFTKSEDWSSEFEYRWAYYNYAEEEGLIKYRDSLEAVVLGLKCPEIYLRFIKSILNGTNTKLFKLDWNINEMEFDMIDFNLEG